MNCESDAPQPTDRTLGHDRRRPGRPPDRLRAARPPDRGRTESSVPLLPGQRGIHPARPRGRRRGWELVDPDRSEPLPGVRRRRRLRRPPPRPGACRRQGERHPRDLRLLAGPRRRPPEPRRPPGVGPDARRSSVGSSTTPAPVTCATRRRSSTTGTRRAPRCPTRTDSCSACRSCRARCSTKSAPSPASSAVACCAPRSRPRSRPTSASSSPTTTSS